MLIDSSVLIDYLRGSDEAAAFLEGLERCPAISCLSMAELWAGVKGSAEEAAVSALEEALIVHEVTARIARRGGDIRRRYIRSHGLDLIDALIGATALEHALTLATLNTKHFPANEDKIRPY